MIKTLSVTEAARNFSDVVARAHYREETTLLTKAGKPVAQIVPVRQKPMKGHELAAAWRSWPRLSPDEVDAFADELLAARLAATLPTNPWG